MKFRYGQENLRIPIPETKENEMFAIANKVLGGSRIDVHSEDGKSRLARIPGRMKRRMGRIRMGDLIIISPWEIQNEKADIIYLYRKNQVRFLNNRNMLPDEIVSLV
jgi:translation initiation factor 1A